MQVSQVVKIDKNRLKKMILEYSSVGGSAEPISYYNGNFKPQDIYNDSKNYKKAVK